MRTLIRVIFFSISLFLVSISFTYAAEYMAPEVKVFNTDKNIQIRIFMLLIILLKAEEV